MLNWFRKLRKQRSAPQLPPAKDEYDRAVLADIARVGWSVICIEADGQEATTPFAFSVGIYHTHQHPEIIMLGLPPQVAGTIINQIGAMIVLGNKIEPDRKYEEFTNTGNIFKTVDPKHYEAYCGYARWLYRGDDFPMLQCVWPLKSGHYPWDEGYPPEGAEVQPLLV